MCCLTGLVGKAQTIGENHVFKSPENIYRYDLFLSKKITLEPHTIYRAERGDIVVLLSKEPGGYGIRF